MSLNFRPRLFHQFNPNISDHPHFRGFLKLLIPTIILISFGYGVLGFFIDTVVERITPAQEQWLWNVLKKEYLSPNQKNILPKETEHVRKIFARIPKKALRYPYPYEVYVVQGFIPNAYAFPGGNIIITSAMMKALKDPNSLLFVLGHELGHFQNRDHLKKLGRDLVMTDLLKWTLGSGVAAAFARFSLIYSRAYSRAEELRADFWGLYLLDQAKGDMKGAIRFLDWLMEEDVEAQIWHTFLSTHPSSVKRRKVVMRWIETKIYKDAQPKIWDQILVRLNIKKSIHIN